MINYNYYLFYNNKNDSANIDYMSEIINKIFNYENGFIFIDIDCDSNGINGT